MLIASGFHIDGMLNYVLVDRDRNLVDRPNPNINVAVESLAMMRQKVTHEIGMNITAAIYAGCQASRLDFIKFCSQSQFYN